jgi:DNA-binding SARP family transcriptional activator
MANVTLSIDDKLLRAARVRAVKEGTSVNEICRTAIEAYARADSASQRLRRFDALMSAAQAEQPAGGPLPQSWSTREEMYTQVLEQRHPTLLGGKASKARR